MNTSTLNRGVSLITGIKDTFFLPVFLVITMISCSKTGTKNDPPIVSAPELTTTAVSIITQYSAWSGGNVSSPGANVTARGVCWSINPGPTTSDSKTSDSTGTGNYNSVMTGLTPSTKYYFRSYGTNSKGTAYGNELSFTTQDPSATSVTDIDGNVYAIVTIGTQTWMKENLKVTHYRNGDPIPTGLSGAAWGATTSGAIAIYNNDAANNAVYGNLYNWYAAVDTRNIAPPGWHVPSEDERTTLFYGTPGGWDLSGGELKESGTTHWNAPNTGATNASGFTGLPAGNRMDTGDYLNMGDGGYWWTTTDEGPGSTDAEAMGLFTNNVYAAQISGSKLVGCSIRCIKD
jgi:uncharacterized protein (TIGR02145 family)